ncbi:isocitrate/isopropylmalate dehydrogenase family protein [Pikeienuella sp. HZG-20]|uniref:isocitrate/isopropylmalate dehydrogenase family protein n=1 Tax=Paludibacillus litoralis TaxID=3133267 RepID=UPI0030EE36AE
MQAFNIAVFPGDGIGHEVTPAAEAVLEAAAARCGFSLALNRLQGGAACWRDTGHEIPPADLKAAEAADAIFLAAMGLPDVRYPDGREITPQISLRFHFDLYAGVRPVRPIPGVRRVLADERSAGMDYVILRESTEGLFAPAAKGSVGADEARETMLITRKVSEKLFDFAFRMAERRKAQGRPGHVTCVDKANVFPAFWFFRDIFKERAKGFPAIETGCAYVDAFAMTMAQRPWAIDVAVTENMFGDILSDLGAALMGGMGYAPSADIGDAHAVFQPCHGTAPDIAGKGIANPTAMILSGAMMLEWLDERQGAPEAGRAAAMIRQAVDAAFAPGRLVTCELGGAAGVDKVRDAVLAELARADA